MVAEAQLDYEAIATDGKTNYVAGFLFEGDRVALVRKKRPAWQKNRYNGIGGHVEPGESPLSAMVREFYEETGYRTVSTQWWPFCVLSGEDWSVHFFSSYGRLSELKTTTDEEIVVLPISEITIENSIPNLTWLIPMSKSIFIERAHTFRVQEEY
jgi:8-oxo-dGTP diphosphatase